MCLTRRSLQPSYTSLKPVIRSLLSERFMGDEVIFYIQGQHLCYTVRGTWICRYVLTHLLIGTRAGVDDELDILYDDISTMLTLTQGLLDEVRKV